MRFCTFVCIVVLGCSSSDAHRVHGVPTVIVHPDVPVSTAREFPHVETTIAGNPRDSQNLVGSAIAFVRPDTSGPNTRAAATTFFSRDGGETWAESSIPEQLEHGGYNARVAFGPDGTAYFTAISTAPGFLVYRSEDGGETWQAPVDIGVGGDYPTLTVDPRTGHIFITANYNFGFPPDTSEIRLFISDDDGRSFSAPVQAARSDSITTGRWGLLNRNTAVFADGTLFIPYWDMPRGADFMQMFVTTADGIRFSEPAAIEKLEHGPYRAPVEGRVIPRSGGTGKPSTYTIDVGTDRLYAAWTDYRHGRPRVQISSSGDRGTTWSSPVLVDPAVPDSASQFNAKIAAAEGVLGIIWFDTRRHPAEDAFDLFFSASFDGGNSFTSAQRVTSSPSRPQVWTGGGYASVRHFTGGDYIGLTAGEPRTFHAFWPDARTGIFQIRSARIEVMESEVTASRGVPGSSSNTKTYATVPAVYAEQPGNSASLGFLSTRPARSQTVYAAAEFAQLEGVHEITAIALRPQPHPAYSGDDPYTQRIDRLRIDLATTGARPDLLSPEFEQNLGADRTTVFDGPLSFSTEYDDFDVVIPFQKPFRYDPARGNLLLDVHNMSGAALQRYYDAAYVMGDGVSSVTVINPAQPVGTPSTSGLIIRFTVRALQP